MTSNSGVMLIGSSSVSITESGIEGVSSDIFGAASMKSLFGLLL